MLTLFIISFLSLGVTAAIDDKCGACKIVANELISRLESEGPKNHIDMRNRISESGKRYGKVIEYRLSELRMIELLEDVCNVCEKYTWGYYNPNDGSPLQLGWVDVKTSQEISIGLSREETKGRRKELNAYCGRLIEDYEDDLVKAIKTGFDEKNELVDVLCTKLAKACESPSVGHGEL